MTKCAISHPLAFSLLPVLVVYAGNVGECPPSQLLRPVVGAVMIAAVLWGLHRWLTGDGRKAALLTSGLLVYLSYAALVWAPVLRWSGSLAGVVRASIVVVSVLGYAAAALWLRRSASTLAGASSDCTWLGWGMLAVLVAIIVLRTPASCPPGACEPAQLWKALPAADPPSAPPVPPDIYYLVLDGYARHDMLAAHYGWDNADLREGLRRRGFFVADASYANYCQTALSLASSLNMAYLEPLAAVAGPAPSREVLQQAIAKNRLTTALRERGYQVTALRTGYWPTELPTADQYLEPPAALSEFEAVVLESSVLGSLVKSLTGRSGFANHRATVHFALAQLPELPRRPSPQFVFAHIVCPHPPFVFGSQGEPVQPAGPFFLGGGTTLYDPAQYQAGYRAQIQFISRQVLPLIDAIQQRSAVPPIIVLQADHGPGRQWDPTSLERTHLTERFAILNAVCLPGVDHADLPATLTPVNTFRLVLKRYWGVPLEPLPNRCFFSTWAEPLRFVEVTERLGWGVSPR